MVRRRRTDGGCLLAFILYESGVLQPRHRHYGGRLCDYAEFWRYSLLCLCRYERIYSGSTPKFFVPTDLDAIVSCPVLDDARIRAQRFDKDRPAVFDSHERPDALVAFEVCVEFLRGFIVLCRHLADAAPFMPPFRQSDFPDAARAAFGVYGAGRCLRAGICGAASLFGVLPGAARAVCLEHAADGLYAVAETHREFSDFCRHSCGVSL